MKIMKHEFVEFIPDVITNDVIYVSIPYATVVHNCACGCGNETVTPLSPRDWSLTYDGDSITLVPSIGNWSLTCRSHYWIRKNNVIWARDWSDAEVAAGRHLENLEEIEYFYDANQRPSAFDVSEEPKLIRRLVHLVRRLFI
jgi:hypothetical protein